MISFQRMSGALGAEVGGIDLRQPLTPEAAEIIRRGLNEHQVLVFRAQELLSVDEHRAFALNFGETQPTSFQDGRGGPPDLLILDETNPTPDTAASEAANFHADNTFRPTPPLGVILQARIVPEFGGDTCVASMHAAYEALSPRMQAYLDGLEASHSYARMVERLSRKGRTASFDLADYPPVSHPVVATHPETGRRMLFVNYNWTTHIEGLPADESATILKFLFEHIKTPSFQVRVRWGRGDVVFWDNLATQHFAVPDYNTRRLLHRVTVRGRAQIGVTQAMREKSAA